MDARSVFEILMRENAAMLMAWLRTAVRDSHAAEDLFQETMLVAWRKLDGFDSSRPFGPWLRGIAGREVLAWYRRQSRQALQLDESHLAWLEARFSEIQSLDGDTFQEKLAALRSCVEGLPDHYRQTVRLRYSESLELEEAAGRLQLTVEAIRKRLTRARLMLSDCLERKLAAGGMP